MLVQLVCLDRRYQRMNCYNIREIQTILKSKYSPATSDSADVHFNLNDTAVGLRYQIGGLDFIGPAIFTFYKNSIFNNSQYRAVHDFLHKPILEFDTVKLFMSNCSLMFSVLKVMYEDETLDPRHLFTVVSNTSGNSYSSILSSVVPGNSLNFSMDLTSLSSITPSYWFSSASHLFYDVSRDSVRPLMFAISTTLKG
jgi:hypothetical protein